MPNAKNQRGAVVRSSSHTCPAVSMNVVGTEGHIQVCGTFALARRSRMASSPSRHLVWLTVTLTGRGERTRATVRSNVLLAFTAPPTRPDPAFLLGELRVMRRYCLPFNKVFRRQEVYNRVEGVGVALEKPDIVWQ